MSEYNGAAEDAAAAAIVAGATNPAAPAPNPAPAPAPAPDPEAEKAAAADKAAAEIEAANKAREEAEAEDTKVDDTVQYQYNPTGDAGLDIALEFIGKLGFAADNPAVAAATTGDFTKIEAALQSLGDKAKGYERYLALAKAAFESRIKAAKAKAEADEQTVYKAVGGKEEWDKIAAFTKANADDAEKAQIEAALKAGGIQAAAMARLLQSAYQRANPTTPRVVREGASATPTSGGGRITPQEYAAKVREIRNKTRGPIDNNPEYLALRAQFAKQ